MTRDCGNDFYRAMIHLNYYRDIIATIEKINIMTKDNMDKLHGMLSLVESTIKDASRVFADSIKSNMPPEDVYDKDDKESVKRSIITSYAKSMYANGWQKLVGVILTSKEWWYHEVEKKSYRTDLNFSDKVNAQAWVEKYYTLQGYIVLDDGYDSYEFVGIVVRSDLKMIRGSDGKPAVTSGDPYVTSPIDDSTMFVTKDKIHIQHAQ